jgi:DNA-binding NtrC family response regulator
MGGIELAQHIEQLRPGIPVILASGYPRSAMLGSAGVSDRFAFIAKPYRWTELADKIRAATHASSDKPSPLSNAPRGTHKGPAISG